MGCLIIDRERKVSGFRKVQAYSTCSSEEKKSSAWGMRMKRVMLFSRRWWLKSAFQLEIIIGSMELSLSIVVQIIMRKHLRLSTKSREKRKNGKHIQLIACNAYSVAMMQHHTTIMMTFHNSLACPTVCKVRDDTKCDVWHSERWMHAEKKVGG